MWLVEGELWWGWWRFATGQGPPRHKQGGVRADGLVKAQEVGLAEEPCLARELFEPEVNEETEGASVPGLKKLGSLGIDASS